MVKSEREPRTCRTRASEEPLEPATTKCASATDDTCAQNYVLGVAAKLYRQPLDPRATQSLMQVFTDVKAADCAHVRIGIDQSGRRFFEHRVVAGQ